jgi:hypothetical protein
MRAIALARKGMGERELEDTGGRTPAPEILRDIDFALEMRERDKRGNVRTDRTPIRISQDSPCSRRNPFELQFLQMINE